MSRRPPTRKSGRAPKSESYLPIEPIDPLTMQALEAAVYIQNVKGVPDVGTKAAHVSRLASDLELACVLKKPKDETDRLCLDVAALALRLLEQGD
jgi:hypothetical protein